jgi:transposase-like protein
MKCKRCGAECERRTGLMNWRGVSFASWLCRACNALYEDEEDSMLAHIAGRGQRADADGEAGE